MVYTDIRLGLFRRLRGGRISGLNPLNWFIEDWLFFMFFELGLNKHIFDMAFTVRTAAWIVDSEFFTVYKFVPITAPICFTPAVLLGPLGMSSILSKVPWNRVLSPLGLNSMDRVIGLV